MRRLFLFAAVLALPLLLIACGGNGSSSIFSPDAVRAAPERAAEEKTFKFEFKATFSGGDESGGGMFDSLFGDGMSLHGEGAVDLENDRTHFMMDIIFMEMEVIQIGTTCYTRSNWFGDMWEMDENCTDDVFEGDDFFFGDNPAAMFDLLREMGDEIEDLGDDTVRDVRARHFRVTVHDAAFDFSGEGFPVDVWIDESGRPVKFLFEMSVDDNDPFFAGEEMHTSLEFYFFDWGQPVDIQPPPEDQIGEFDFFGDWDDDWEWDDDDWFWDDDDWLWDDDDWDDDDGSPWGSR